MLDHNHYPRWIDPVHERPVLSARTESWIGDWAWLMLIIVALGLAFLIH